MYRKRYDYDSNAAQTAQLLEKENLSLDPNSVNAESSLAIQIPTEQKASRASVLHCQRVPFAASLACNQRMEFTDSQICCSATLVDDRTDKRIHDESGN